MSDQKSENDISYDLHHDTFFKETFKMRSLAVAFLKKFLPPETLEWLDLGNLTIEPTQFVDDMFRKTWADMVYKVPIIGMEEHVSVHIILEHKSYNDGSAIFQIWKYITRLCIQDVEKRLTDTETQKRKTWTKDFRLSPVIPIILHHGDSPFTGETELFNLFHPLPGAEDFLPRLKAVLVDLSTMKDEELPRDPDAPELHVVLMILKTVFDQNKTVLSRKLSAIVEELKPYSQIPMYHELIRLFWYYMANNAKKMTKSDAEELETEIREMIGDKNMQTWVQTYIDEGRAEGRVEGEIEREAKTVLRVLARRFRAVPKPLETRIFAITNLAYLEKLTDLAFDCESLDEFAAAIK